MMIKKLGIGFLSLIAIFTLYMLLWPVPVESVAFVSPAPPSLSGVYAVNDRLHAVETLIQYPQLRPEEVVFDSQGNIYASTKEGRILRFKSDGNAPEIFAETGGRPNGMAFDKSGNLIIADALKGLLSIAPNGTVTVLADDAGNWKIALANDLAITNEGLIYFSDSQFHQDDGTLDLMDGRPLGRLLVYDPKTGKIHLELDGLYYANGVTLSPDESFILVTESFAYRVRRYWLTGPKQGQTDYFVENLPGLPDNITFNGKDKYWLALYQSRDPTLEALQAHPFLRKIVMRLPAFFRESAIPSSYGWVLGLDLSGKVIYNLQDPSGKFASSVSSVTEHDGQLYLGTFGREVIQRIPVP